MANECAQYFATKPVTGSGTIATAIPTTTGATTKTTTDAAGNTIVSTGSTAAVRATSTSVAAGQGMGLGSVGEVGGLFAVFLGVLAHL